MISCAAREQLIHGPVPQLGTSALGGKHVFPSLTNDGEDKCVGEVLVQ